MENLTAMPGEIYSILSPKHYKPARPRFGVRGDIKLILFWLLPCSSSDHSTVLWAPAVLGLPFLLGCRRGSIFRWTPGRCLGSTSRSCNCMSWGVSKQQFPCSPPLARQSLVPAARHSGDRWSAAPTCWSVHTECLLCGIIEL